MKNFLEFKKRSAELFNKHYPLSAIILLFAVVLLSLWQLPFLYFWTDDWDLFLKVIHPELGLWGMAPGWFGSGPYRYLHTPFMPLYPLFGLNASPYFAISILVYFCAVITSFLLFLEVTRKKLLAFIAAVVYASAPYIGSYTIFHLSNSYQNLSAVIFTNLTLWILIKYYRSSNILHYILSIVLFYVSLEFANLRSHGLIWLVFGATFLFANWSKKNFFINLARLIPFVLIYRQLYSATISFGSGSYETTLGVFVRSLTRDHLFAYFVNPFYSLGNVIIPDEITKFVFSLFKSSPFLPELVLLLIFISSILFFSIRRKVLLLGFGFIILEIIYFLFNKWAFSQQILAHYDKHASLSSMLGMTLLLLLLLTSLVLWKKQLLLSRSILFGIVLIFGHYIGYFIGATSYSYLSTTDRYLTPSVVGVALVLAVVFSIPRIRKLSLALPLTLLYSGYLIFIMNASASYVIENVSNPARRIHEDIKKVVSKDSVSSRSALLVQYENDPNLMYQFNSTFPPTALALFYNQGNRLLTLTSLGDYLYAIKNNKMKEEDLLSIYITKKTVINTTSEIRKLLRNPSDFAEIDLSKWSSNTDFTSVLGQLSTGNLIFERDKDTLSIEPRIEGKVSYTSVVPSVLRLTITASPIDVSSYKLPFVDVSEQFPYELVREDLVTFSPNKNSTQELPCKDVDYLLSLDKEHKDFMASAKVNTTTQARYSEKEFMVDGLNKTNWGGNTLYWSSNKKEEVSIDLGVLKEISKLIWVNYLPRTSPTEYDILISEDGSNWNKVKEIKNAQIKIEGEYVVDEFDKVFARYVKMIIKNTSSNLSPSISEIWVSSSTNTRSLSSYPQQLIEKPLLCPIESGNDYIRILGALEGRIEASLFWLTNAFENFNESNSGKFTIIADGLPHTYEIHIPNQGTTLEKVRISRFQLPINITIHNVSIKSLTQEELDVRGLIPPGGWSN